MPIYEYRCAKCGVFEVTQRITEHALKRCPTCKGKVERLLSATSFVLKGSGWYATDYASKSKSKPEGAAADTKADNGSGSDTPSATDSGSKTADSDSSAKTSASDSTSKTAAADAPAKPTGKKKSAAAKSSAD